MKRLPAGLGRFYAALVQFYPRTFRDEFSEEMKETFAELCREAAAQGRGAFMAVCWRELCLAPLSIVREHCREGRYPSMTAGATVSEFKPVTGLGILAAISPFLAASLVDLGPILGASSGYVAFAVLAVLVVLLALGLVRGLPSWCLPIFGFFLTLPAFAMLVVWAPLFFFYPSAINGLRLVIGSGGPWFSIAVIGLIAVGSMLFLPGRALVQRVRRDWIWIAFALYGSAAWWLWLTFDEYVGEQPYVFAASAVLIAGVLTYVRAQRPRARFVILLSGLLLALLIVAYGKWNLVPTQTWPIPINEGLAWNEVESTIVTGVWMVLGILGIPGLVPLLPTRRGDSTVITT